MSKYTLESKPFAPLPGFHHGTGAVAGSAHVVDPSSVTQDVNEPLKFNFSGFKIRVMSVEIDTTDAPNWFGVSFREGLSSFDTVNIFCHPYPGSPQAGMRDEDYPSRSGQWPKLFRYAEIFGRQISIARADHITIIPFFTNATYDSTGIFGPNWKDIVEQILVLAHNVGNAPLPPAGKAKPAETPIDPLSSPTLGKKGGPRPPVNMSGTLKHLVLSDFSHGRKLMWSVRSQSPGMKSFLREMWDFDGVHAPPPFPGILYDQAKASAGGSKTFHVPGERWQEYHHAILSHDQLHGDIPAMLACHAATISSVG